MLASVSEVPTFCNKTCLRDTRPTSPALVAGSQAGCCSSEWTERGRSVQAAQQLWAYVAATTAQPSWRSTFPASFIGNVGVCLAGRSNTSIESVTQLPAASQLCRCRCTHCCHRADSKLSYSIWGVQ